MGRSRPIEGPYSQCRTGTRARTIGLDAWGGSHSIYDSAASSELLERCRIGPSGGPDLKGSKPPRPARILARASAMRCRNRGSFSRRYSSQSSSDSKPMSTPAGLPCRVMMISRATASCARRLKRVFGVEVEVCARCGGKLKIIASIEEPEVIAKILSHRNARPRASTSPSCRCSARAPRRRRRQVAEAGQGREGDFLGRGPARWGHSARTICRGRPAGGRLLPTQGRLYVLSAGHSRIAS